MFQGATDRRFRRLAEERSTAEAVAIGSGLQHGARVRRALALAVNGGIAAEDAYPALFRALAAIGLVVRPVHFLPVWVPALIGALFGGLMVLPVFAIMELVAVRVPVLGGLAGWIPAGVILGAVVMGTLFATVIRVQAARAGLPHWSRV
jgi:hypothetical protein